MGLILEIVGSIILIIIILYIYAPILVFFVEIVKAIFSVIVSIVMMIGKIFKVIARGRERERQRRERERRSAQIEAWRAEINERIAKKNELEKELERCRPVLNLVLLVKDCCETETGLHTDSSIKEYRNVETRVETIKLEIERLQSLVNSY